MSHHRAESTPSRKLPRVTAKTFLGSTINGRDPEFHPPPTRWVARVNADLPRRPEPTGHDRFHQPGDDLVAGYLLPALIPEGEVVVEAQLLNLSRLEQCDHFLWGADHRPALFRAWITFGTVVEPHLQ